VFLISSNRCVWRVTAARAPGPAGTGLPPETGVLAAPFSFYNNGQCIGELRIPVDQNEPQGVLVRGHAGPAINKLSLKLFLSPLCDAKTPARLETP